MAGRHVRRRRGARWLPLVGTAVAVALIFLVVQARPYLERRNLLPGEDGCDRTLTVNVVTGPELAGLLSQFAGDYAQGRHRVGNQCVQPTVTADEPGAVVHYLARDWKRSGGAAPDVWLPASSTWADVLEARRPGLLDEQRPKVATSPLVIAMPRPMAQALGWPKRPLGWGELLAAMRDPAGWARFGQPKWGPVLVGKTDPHLSTAGMQAGVAAVLSSTGKLKDPAAAAADRRLAATVVGVERAPGPYAGSSTALLTDLQRADDRGGALRFASALPLTEKSLRDYNLGNPSGNPETLGQHRRPKVPLVAVYPREGTFVADHPFLTLRARWVGEEKRRAAADFLRFLRSDPVQARLLAAGFRTWQGTAGPEATTANGILPGEPRAVLPSPPAKLVQAIDVSWEKARKRGNVLAVIDASGSMAGQVPGTRSSKLDLVKEAAGGALPLFSDQDRLGLWQFSSHLDGDRPYRIVVPLGRVSESPGGTPRRQAMAGGLQAMRPGGRTGLYETTLAAVDYMRRHWVPDRINTVVLLTDGEDDNTASGLTLAALVKRLEAANRDRPVRVITIAYGPEADTNALRQIAGATKGATYELANPKDIQRVFISAISRF
ncbi:MAG TPA: substrate-binding and VWA domain-containing protein [Actinomycetota bacterium]|nr:substrate-binding and VWA domain-containing protein [Actinomycetota bacterium]